jgi:hypothetical protein
LQEFLDKLSAGVDFHVNDDTGATQFHLRYRQGYEVDARAQNSADSRSAGKAGSDRCDFIASEADFGQGQPRMADQDLSLARGCHAPGIPFEELHAELAFDLVQQLGSGWLRKTCRRRGSCRAALVVEMHEDSQLARLQMRAESGAACSHGYLLLQ